MLIFDIETDGLLDATTKVHCLTIYDTETDESRLYSSRGDYPQIPVGVERLAAADCVCGHNVLAFDIPALTKVYPSFAPKGEVVDTLTISRLIWTNLADLDFTEIRRAKTPAQPMFFFPKKLVGSHSLKAWGYRLGVLKGEFGETTDWQEWSEEMCAYNRQDVVVTRALWERIQEQDYSQTAIDLEHQFQKIILQQEQNGFPFNQEKAVLYYSQLAKRREELTQELQRIFPPEDKGDWFVPKVNNAKRGYVKGERVWRARITAFNPGSRKDIAERLRETRGWEPQEYTERGTPKVDEEVLSALDWPEAKALSEYFLVQKRIGQLAEGNNAWLKLVGRDGRIHGHVITNGAVTGRCTHVSPNMAQVPAVGVPWGAEFRSLFYAPPGWSVLGADASGLELRCLAHFMARYDGGAYARKILEGDIHWANAQALGLVAEGEKKDPENPYHMWARNKVAKRFIYALNYGAGDHKLGELVELTDDQAKALLAAAPKSKIDQISARLAKQFQYKTITFKDIAQSLKGAELRATFMKNLPALASLIEDVKRVAKKRGYLIGLDKRRLNVRSIHSAFNTLLQSAGAIAVKKATCVLWDDLTTAGLADKVQQVAHVHDEYQLLVKEGEEEHVGQIAIAAFGKAGLFFEFRIPLAGEFKFGRNWAETH